MTEISLILQKNHRQDFSCYLVTIKIERNSMTLLVYNWLACDFMKDQGEIYLTFTAVYRDLSIFKNTLDKKG